MKNRLLIPASILLLTAAIAAAIVAVGCGRHNPTAPMTSTVTGQLFGVVRISVDSIPEAVRPEHIDWMQQPVAIDHGTTTWSRQGDMYEFRTTYPTDSLEVTVGGQPAIVDSTGHFIATGVPVGNQQIEFKVAGIPVRSVPTVVTPTTCKFTYDVVYDPSKMAMHHMGTGAQGTAETFPCLKYNGPLGFIYSDCYVSLFYGPWQYRWMCWSEAMDSAVSSSYRVWCNGTHNCSLFVHHWDWNAQRWHWHYGPWKP